MENESRTATVSGCREIDEAIRIPSDFTLILDDGVYDMGPESPHMDRGYLTIRIGDTHLYSTRFPTADETYNISVRNVRGGGIYVVSLAGEIRNFSMYGIEAFNGAKMLDDQRGKQ